MHVFQHGGHITKDLFGSGPNVLGGASLPKIITDDFSADSGLWLDGDLSAAAITISGGRGSWAPTLGAEIVSNGGFETGDPPSGWTNYNAATTFESSAAQVLSGAAALHVADAGGTRGTYQILTLTQPAWYAWDFNWYAVSSAIVTFVSFNGNVPAFVSSTTGAWVNRSATSLVTAANPRITIYAQDANNDFYVDDLSGKPITPASMYRVQRVYYPCSSVSAKLWLTTWMQSGVTLYLDANNYIQAWIEQTGAAAHAAKLRKCVGGTLSAELGTGAITYSDGTALALVPNSAFTAFTVQYGGADIISDAAITDFTASGTWYAGIFSSDTANTFDDFAATKV